MTPGEAVAALLARIGANGGAAVIVGAAELADWPATLVAAFKAGKLLVPTRPAASVVCPGCEQQCVMPVHVPPGQEGEPRAFVVCDKRNDINRVNVPVGLLAQWQASGATVAAWLGRELNLPGATGQGETPSRWEVGMLRGARHASHLVLIADGELKLTLAGHSLRLVDALDCEGERIAIDRRMLVRCVDNPVAGAGDAESAEQRRTRLAERVRQEKIKRTRAFLKVVADEEAISVSRLKQILAGRPDTASESLLARPSAAGPGSTRRKAKH